MSVLTHEGEKLYLDGREFYLASGSMHYFRYQPEGWRHRLKLMKAFGLTAVQTYVPWNLHEPREGEYHFEGNLNLKAFLRMCLEEGLYVMLRPSPYICSECDWGGQPSWLMKYGACPRTMDEGYLIPYRRYFERLCSEFIPMLSTNGGPVIAVALENEYGSYAMDNEYLRFCEKMYMENGIDVPLYTTGGPDMFSQIFGGFPEIWSAINVSPAGVCGGIEAYHRFQTGFPVFVGEMWGGRAQQWGGVFNRQSAESVAASYKKALEAGAYVNFYMFCGGTNFGFFSGANYGVFRADVPGAKKRYVPFCTSYDVDAPVDEQGRPTKKYYLCREVLARYRGMGLDELPPVPDNMPAQAPENITWLESRRMFQPDVLDALTEKKIKSGNVRPMEDLGQDYGWILYTVYIRRTDPSTTFELYIDGLQDRADIYADGTYLGTYYRDRNNVPVRFRVTEDKMRLDILAENMGRICFGYKIPDEKKGILNCVRLKAYNPKGQCIGYEAFVTNWEIRSLPMTGELLKSCYVPESVEDDRVQPRIYRGKFSAVPGTDTCLDFVKTHTMKKGFVCVNGFNLGRYWEIGPQETLYIPGELLKEENILEIFELYGEDRYPEPVFCRDISLDGLTENAETVLNG